MAPTDRPVTSLINWEGKYLVAESLIGGLPGIHTVSVKPGTRGRPVDSITITADPKQHPRHKYKKLVQDIEVLLKNLLSLSVDYRVISIVHK